MKTAGAGQKDDRSNYFLGRVTFLLYNGYNFCSLFKTKSSPYNVTVFGNWSSFSGEEIWYTIFASWVVPITDKNCFIEMEEKYDCSETEPTPHVKPKT